MKGGGQGGLEVFGSLMKSVAALLGRQPVPELTLRGFYGMTLKEGEEFPVVQDVLDKGPAGAARLQVGDVVTKVQDRTVTDIADVLRFARRLSPGSKVKLTVQAARKRRTSPSRPRRVFDMRSSCDAGPARRRRLRLGGCGPGRQCKPVTVPFELLKSGHMAVQVKVNGKGPYWLIFDTGAPISLLNMRIAREAGLTKGVEQPAFSLFNALGEVKIKTLEVGTQKSEDVSAVVMDHPTIQAIGSKLGKRIDGLVGFPFFAGFRMTLDYQAKTMTLVPSGFKPPDVMQSMMTLMLGGTGRRTLAPAAQWGVLASKEAGDEADGVDVRSVVPGSAADKAGLKRGDRLLTLDGRWTDSLADLYEAAAYVKAGNTVVVRVKRGDKEMELKVTPARGL